jgi:acetoin utilization protein AcuB
MKVKQRMTTSPITITPHTTHSQAVALMRENHIRRLPVLDKHGKLVGIVSHKDLLSTAPSPATTLSVYEIYTLLDALTVDKFMVHPVLAVNEDCSIAAAARFMISNTISCLPVMRGDELVGLITETDIFKTFVEVLGGDEPGLRIDLSVPEKRGMIAEIATGIANAGGNIVSLTTFHGDDATHGEISIKERGAEEKRVNDAMVKIEGVKVLTIRPAGQDGILQFG